MLLLLQLLHEDGFLLVLAPLVLEPDADDPRAQAGHLHQLLLHERVGPRVGGVARPQCVQLLLVQHGSHAGCLLGLFVHVWAQRRLPAGSRVCEGARGEPAAATHSPCAPPRGGRAPRGPISFVFSSVYFVFWFVCSLFLSVRPIWRKVCTFVPSLVPPPGSPPRSPQSKQGLGVPSEACAGQKWLHPAVPPPLTRPSEHPQGFRGTREALRKRRSFRRRGRRGAWDAGRVRGPSAALRRDKGACLPLPGVPEETVSLIPGPLGQGQTVCH